MSKEDLKPCRTKEEAKERGKRGGKASGIARKRKRTLREAMRLMLTDTEISDSLKQRLMAEGVGEEDLTHTFVITRSLIAKAEKGDVSAYNAIRDILGEKPTDTLAIDIPKSLSISVVNVGAEYLAETEDDVQV